PRRVCAFGAAPRDPVSGGSDRRAGDAGEGRHACGDRPMSESFLLGPVMPELFLAIAGMALLMFGVFRVDNSRAGVVAVVAANARLLTLLVVGALLIAVVLVAGGSPDRISIFADMFVSDAFSGYSKLLILIGSALTLAISVDYNEREDMGRFEYSI